MIKSLLTITFLIALFMLPNTLFARNPQNIIGDHFEEVASGRRLEIHTNPTGVRVYIDGAYRGLTPLVLEQTVFREHNIRLTREGYRERDFNVLLTGTSSLIVSIQMEELRGIVFVYIQREAGSSYSAPLNPRINTSALGHFLSDIPVPDDNQVILSLPVGFNTIRTRAFGWDDSVVTIFVDEHITTHENIIMRPAIFRMGNAAQNRRRFNPLNPNNLGITVYRFEVTAPGTGTITILNNENEVVFQNYLDVFETPQQQITWNGRDLHGNPLPQGIYTVLIEASPLETPLHLTQQEQGMQPVTLRLETIIDYSAIIIPLSSDTGVSGLKFSPTPHVLPRGSFQFDIGVHAGNFLITHTSDDINDGTQNNESTLGFPFKLNARVSPFNRLELAAALNIIPYPDNETGFGLSASIKYNFPNNNNTPLSFAGGISYAWAGTNGEFPSSPGGGLGLHAPLSLELTNFSIVFCPALFWRSSADFMPTLLFSTGILFRANQINIGVSARYELDFSENILNTRFLTGAEIHFFPPPSNLVFSLVGGLIHQEQFTGAYAGLRIGIIN
ncbi:MAG: PEGA domain-containing protein [Treponema sp.]|nr:PEGA domain-containing protein [Treponema sp.]